MSDSGSAGFPEKCVYFGHYKASIRLLIEGFRVYMDLY